MVAYGSEKKRLGRFGCKGPTLTTFHTVSTEHPDRLSVWYIAPDLLEVPFKLHHIREREVTTYGRYGKRSSMSMPQPITTNTSMGNLSPGYRHLIRSCGCLMVGVKLYCLFGMLTPHTNCIPWGTRIITREYAHGFVVIAFNSVVNYFLGELFPYSSG